MLVAVCLALLLDVSRAFLSQGQAVAQLARTVEGVTVIGVASKSKHEAIQGSIDHIIERGTDYASEVRK